jgi:hypothetical protein
MAISRLRAVMLGLLAITLVGAVMATTASAEAGPFWRHRVAGEEKETEGQKIEPSKAESFSGTGSTQTLNGTVSGVGIEITSSSTQVKGAIFNNALQGQVKIELIFNQPTLVKPVLSNCLVTIGTRNIIVAKGHLMWKWNGTAAQLLEQPQAAQVPDLAFTAVEPTQQKPFAALDYRKNGVFSTVTLSGGGCGVLGGTFPVEGSEVGILNRNLETWSKKLSIRTLPGGLIKKEVGEGEGFLQHFWDGEAFQSAIIGLKFGGNPANLTGQTNVEAAQQEISIFEK